MPLPLEVVEARFRVAVGLHWVLEVKWLDRPSLNVRSGGPAEGTRAGHYLTMTSARTGGQKARRAGSCARESESSFTTTGTSS